MIKQVSLLALTLIGTAATATAQIPMSKFVRTASSSTSTRGLYFQAPVGFRIIGLRVPDETGSGTQNVEVFDMATQPPAWPATSTGGSVFYQTGVSSNEIIPVNIPISAGHWVGVLGAAGNGKLHSSYGEPANRSNVLGFPVVLNRFLTQTNLLRGGNQAYSSEDSGQIGRVEMWVQPLDPMDLPVHSAIFSAPAFSRGFFFQAPKNMTITGLRVPDITGHGLQNVEIIRMTGAPTAYPTFSTGGSVFHAAGIPSDRIISTDVSFVAGEWIGIFGTCGAAVMHSSYGAGPHATTLFGQPVTLTRFITQANIATSSGNPYAQSVGSITRVEMYARLDEACSEVEMRPFRTTYSDPFTTRGYFFQTPVAISITGLQVPDETSHGIQNVEVFNLGTAPPAFPTTSTGTSVFYAAGAPSNQVLPTNLHFAPGDWVGVLGACGTSTMHNSYGLAGPTDILGHTVQLRRLITQTNLNSGGNQPYTGFPAGVADIGRVHMHLGLAPVGVDYGVGTDAGSGTPTLTTCVLPSIGGGKGQLVAEQFDAGNIGGWLIVGLNRANIPVLNGTLLVGTSIATVPIATPMPVGGEVPINLSIPNDPALINCSSLTFQVITLTPASAGVYNATNGTEWQIGQ